MPSFQLSYKLFKNSFFPSTLNEWYKRDETIKNSESISIFKSRLLPFIRPLKSNVFNIFDPIRLTLLTHLSLGFSHLNEHRFRHNSQDCLSPLCSCSQEIEDTLHYLLHCYHFSLHRIDLMNSVKSILANLESLTDNVKKDIPLYW